VEHCAGTALGDPIELGAALTLLHRKSAPLRLTAAKTHFGHCEPAAGAVGITHAAAMLVQNSTYSIMHLRSMNPTVGNILHTQAALGAAWPCLPRQGSTAPTGSPGTAQTTCGISAFAFQGTNAHAILVKGSTEITSLQQLVCQWERKRFWFALPVLAMAQTVAVTVQTVQIQAALTKAPLGYLWDHRVRNRALLPGTAMFEAGCVAGTLLLSGRYDASLSQRQDVLNLCSVSILTPLLLAPLASPGSSTVLTTTLQLPSGQVTLRSVTAANRQEHVHLAGTFASSLAITRAAAHSRQLASKDLLAVRPTASEATGKMIHPPSPLASICQGADFQSGQYCIHPAVSDTATQVRCWPSLLVCTNAPDEVPGWPQCYRT